MDERRRRPVRNATARARYSKAAWKGMGARRRNQDGHACERVDGGDTATSHRGAAARDGIFDGIFGADRIAAGERGARIPARTAFTRRQLSPACLGRYRTE